MTRKPTTIATPPPKLFQVVSNDYLTWKLENAIYGKRKPNRPPQNLRDSSHSQQATHHTN